MSASAKHHILLILTGGTICSFENAKGEQEADTERAQAVIVQNFRQSDCVYRDEACVAFDVRRPLDILSENMTVTHWNTLIHHLKSYDFSLYDGVILLHGTDTLAYTASLLSLLMAGTKIPILLVSAILPLYNENTNGNANFKAAVELILNGIRPNVYAVYRNTEIVKGQASHTMYLHLGAHLLQCANHSDNFYSCDSIPLRVDNACAEGRACKAREMPLYTCGELFPCVLRILPYVGMDYRHFDLNGVRAVLHGTYHSSTMTVNPYSAAHEDTKSANSPDSILYLKRRCDEHVPPIPLWIEPCQPEKTYLYETTGIVLRSGVGAIWEMTSEMAYVKLLLGCAKGLVGDALNEYLHTEINGEFIR